MAVHSNPIAWWSFKSQLFLTFVSYTVFAQLVTKGGIRGDHSMIISNNAQQSTDHHNLVTSKTELGNNSRKINTMKGRYCDGFSGVNLSCEPPQGRVCRNGIM